MRAVYLIHGFASDRDDYATLAPLLTAYYDEVVCPNLPAHGMGKEKEKLNHKDILEFVENTFDDLKSRHETVDVFGVSMGGALASYIASKREIGRLVLLAPANKYLAPFFVRDTLKWAFLAAREEKKADFEGHESDCLVKEIMADQRKVLKKLFGRFLRRITPNNFIEFTRVIKKCNNALAEINVPAMIIWGEIDQLVPYASVKHVSAYCCHPVTRIHIWKDLSHLMMYSCQYFRIIDAVFRFLEDTDAPMLEWSGGI
ncbi:MAG: alpha/beta fold hydrolase [Firmicutes bacterium]|nr:alpha/beta fold hydrolase [Bacillota bacterium]